MDQPLCLWRSSACDSQHFPLEQARTSGWWHLFLSNTKWTFQRLQTTSGKKKFHPVVWTWQGFLWKRRWKVDGSICAPICWAVLVENLSEHCRCPFTVSASTPREQGPQSSLLGAAPLFQDPKYLKKTVTCFRLTNSLLSDHSLGQNSQFWLFFRASAMCSAHIINGLSLFYWLLTLLLATTNQGGERQDRASYSEVWIQRSQKSCDFCAAQHYELIKHWGIQCSTQQLYCIITWPNSSSFKILVYLLQATIHYHLIFNKKSGMFQTNFNGIRIMCALKYLCSPWDGRITPASSPHTK